MAASGPDDEPTRPTAMPPAGPDDEPTAAHAGLEAVAELRAVFGSGDKRSLPLYTLGDTIVVGRGTASDWQLDDASLSRKHCQFKWNGQALTVEDLGSANGTRVSGRPATRPTPVGKDDVVQLGTVLITFVQLHINAPNPDEQATRLVTAPPVVGEIISGEITPTPKPLAPLATVVRAVPEPAAEAQVFRPEADAAGPDEPTRPWDPGAVLQRAPDQTFDARELWARVKAQWRTNRRPFVLGGAVVWVAILLVLMSWKEKRNAADEEPAPPPPPATESAPIAKEPAPPNVVEPSSDRDQDLADAVAAYDQGRLDEALRLFRRLATDPDDKAAQFMVQLIESRSSDGKGGTP
jgi:predicted component of type VI protein secretion system